MALPNSYTIKIGAIQNYFDALLNAEAPQRFSQKFLESIDFKSKNDRLIINILKEMGFLNADAVPTQRYYKFLDKDKSKKVIAEGIRQAYADLFAIDKDAYKLNLEKVESKLKSLYQGSKTSGTIKLIAKTFLALVQSADFSSNLTKEKINENISEDTSIVDSKQKLTEKPKDEKIISFETLQYHINIVLPESREQSVYDAIFKSLKNHLK